jgi:hypothetical protein
VPSTALRAALLALALTLAAAAPAAAQAADPIEAVWEFTGGQVAIDRQSDGSFLGTVIRETRFAECPHVVGERMWTEVRLQPDGQYFGRHQWFNTPECTYKEPRGNIALRVLRRPDGAVFLRVCFASPDNQDKQPTIAEDGTSANTDVECDDSSFVSAQPSTAPKLADFVSGLPAQTPPGRCASRRRFPIRLKEPPGDAIAANPKPKVTRNGKRIPVVFRAGRWRSVIDLRGLRRGRYTFKITARTVRGRTISGSRRYRTCGRVRRIGTVGPV